MFKKLVGSDYLGNEYYIKNVGDKELRFVKYSTGDFTAISPEWDAWLRHTVEPVPSSTIISDVYCGNVSGSPYAQLPPGHVSKKTRKVFSNYRKWVPQ